MKKYIALVIAFVCVLGLVGCSSEEPKRELTIDELKVIAEKGENILWSDFEPYIYHFRAGSGIITTSYLIGEEYILTIAGWPDAYISSIRLSTAVKVGESTDEYREIDIRTESIDDFINGE